MVFDRPAKPGQSQKECYTYRSGDRPENSSIWLRDDELPLSISQEASFVEYLRWMRSPGGKYENESKLELLQLAREKANYKRLETLTERTKRIVDKRGGRYFEVTCPWRIRVGGHRGPEQILLPAFDSTGMPYIPSSTLRGVARSAAFQEMIKSGSSKEAAEKEVARYFGSLDAEPFDREGKVIFLDAYPLPGESDKGGLTLDMANNIWKWNGDEPEYKPNPNIFLSLKEVTFKIGLLPGPGGNWDNTCKKVKEWLLKGLEVGAGSQINSGYGRLVEEGNGQPHKGEFFRIEFELKGQLIHSNTALLTVMRYMRYNIVSLAGVGQRFWFKPLPCKGLSRRYSPEHPSCTNDAGSL